MTLWKQTERALAKILGGIRNPINGRGDKADIEHPDLAIEVKQRDELPAWIKHAMLQAKIAKGETEKLAVVILHQTGDFHANDLVIVRLKDFVELREKLTKIENELDDAYRTMAGVDY